PSVLALSRQNLPALRDDAGENRSARGAYVIAEATGARDATIVATGSEVEIALTARKDLSAQRIEVAVVSAPCFELFAIQDASYREAVLGSAPRIGIEAACGFGWERWLGAEGAFLGMAGFGASAPAGDLYRHFGLTAEALSALVKRRVQRA
ncbi:MAG: transketolase-like TK C-terminal-containing protein, partial [Acetobacteraceae bacterium]